MCEATSRLRYFEQCERRADDVQSVEAFCSTGSVQRKPVRWKEELHKDPESRKSTFKFFSPTKVQDVIFHLGSLDQYNNVRKFDVEVK